MGELPCKTILIVLDGAGVGELPDADEYGDRGSDTLANTARAVGGLDLPYLQRLGLGNIAPILGVNPEASPLAAWGKMAERSPGKDSTSGHWELAGLILDRPFPLYPNGFPPEVIEPFQRAIGREVLGSGPASGTRIIQELGEEHVRTGKPIVYTSADSVFQVAAHEGVIPVAELYEICRTARRLLTGEHGVARVIARPFVGKTGAYRRTERRKDFSLPPPRDTVLDKLKAAGYPVIGVGKVDDLFAGKGLTEVAHTRDNMETIDATLRYMKSVDRGLIMANLVDFDMLWGHRNDPEAFASGLGDFDARVPALMEAMEDMDVLIITADHGCDPTTPSTDHSREYVPLLAYGAEVQSGVNLGIRCTFADVGATLAKIFRVRGTGNGRSFWRQVKMG